MIYTKQYPDVKQETRRETIEKYAEVQAERNPRKVRRKRVKITPSIRQREREICPKNCRYTCMYTYSAGDEKKRVGNFYKTSNFLSARRKWEGVRRTKWGVVGSCCCSYRLDLWLTSESWFLINFRDFQLFGFGVWSHFLPPSTIFFLNSTFREVIKNENKIYWNGQSLSIISKGCARR